MNMSQLDPDPLTIIEDDEPDPVQRVNWRREAVIATLWVAGIAAIVIAAASIQWIAVAS